MRACDGALAASIGSRASRAPVCATRFRVLGKETSSPDRL
jgi:hypothetical protein